MKVYGSEICSGCREFKALIQERGLQVEFVEITENVANMRAFLRIRDENPLFDAIRAEGRIGIPFFVSDEGEVTLDRNQALAWIGEPSVDEETGCESCK